LKNQVLDTYISADTVGLAINWLTQVPGSMLEIRPFFSSECGRYAQNSWSGSVTKQTKNPQKRRLAVPQPELRFIIPPTKSNSKRGQGPTPKRNHPTGLPRSYQLGSHPHSGLTADRCCRELNECHRKDRRVSIPLDEVLFCVRIAKHVGDPPDLGLGTRVYPLLI